MTVAVYPHLGDHRTPSEQTPAFTLSYYHTIAQPKSSDTFSQQKPVELLDGVELFVQVGPITRTLIDWHCDKDSDVHSDSFSDNDVHSDSDSDDDMATVQSDTHVNITAVTGSNPLHWGRQSGLGDCALNLEGQNISNWSLAWVPMIWYYQ